MKFFNLALPIMSWSSIVIAFPVKAKRQDIWVTETAYVTEVVHATTTIWVEPDTAATPSPDPSTGAFVEKNHQPFMPPAWSKTTAQTVPTSSYSAPSVDPVQTVGTNPTSIVPIASTLDTVSQLVANPTPVVDPTPVVSSISSAPVPSTSSGSSNNNDNTDSTGSASSTGQTYSGGDLTYYEPNGGTGSCGSAIQNSEDVVALPVGMMDGVSTLSNGHPWCGKKVVIYFNGKEFPATVEDKCMGCKVNDIDLTKGLFDKITGGSVDGRGVGLAKWAFAE